MLFCFILWSMLICGIIASMLAFADWFEEHEYVGDILVYIVLFLVSPLVLLGVGFYHLFKLFNKA